MIGRKGCIKTSPLSTCNFKMGYILCTGMHFCSAAVETSRDRPRVKKRLQLDEVKLSTIVSCHLPSLSKVLERLVEIGVSQSFKNIHHKFVFASVMGLLSLTEQWRKELDNHELQDNWAGLYGFVKIF